MRDWLLDQGLLPENDLTDVQVVRWYTVFSRLEVGDCAWRDAASYRRELLHFEQQFAVA